MRVEHRHALANGWRLAWARCECGRPLCTSHFLLAQPELGRRWLVLTVAPDPQYMEDQIETAVLSLEDDPVFAEAAATLCECYGWPWHLLDEDLACASWARMMDISDDLSEELRFWGAVGVRGLRRLAGNAPASCEEALLCLRRARLDDGGGRVTAGPLAR